MGVMGHDRATNRAAFIAALDKAVDLDDCGERCEEVKKILEYAFQHQIEILESDHMRPAEDKYARHLVHRDPAGRYSIVAMVWGVGQGTALHDHAGEWCVECVYRGLIRVTSFDLVGSCESAVVQFKPEDSILAGVGEAGALIPPFEYHIIENALSDEATVTVHVYGHELTHCNIFVPVDGGYRKEVRELSYTA
jgi:predicted metal-dependent enzyme (double-stranded beta helix superfamily)